jgi:hypothetical protein
MTLKSFVVRQLLRIIVMGMIHLSEKIVSIRIAFNQVVERSWLKSR